MRKRATKKSSSGESQKRGELRRKLFVALACLVVAGGITYTAYSFKLSAVHKTVQTISNQLADNMEHNDPTAAYGLTSTDFQRIMNRKDFGNLTGVVSRYTSGAKRHEISWAFKTTKDKQQYAQVNYRYDGGKKPYYMRVIMQKEASVWRVLLINVAETPFSASIPTIEN